MAKKKKSAADKALIVSSYGIGIGGSVISGVFGAGKKSASVANIGRKKALAQACKKLNDCPGCARCR